MKAVARVFLKLAATAGLCSVAIFLVFAVLALVSDPRHLPLSFRAVPRWLHMPGWLGVAIVAFPVTLAGVGVFLGILADIWRD